MSYSSKRGSSGEYPPEEIQKYLNILYEYKRGSSGENPPQCNCKRGSSGENPPEEYMGQWMCVECGLIKGHILGKYDINDFDRLHYQKKSIYHRKYYFEKKVNNISKLIGMNDEEKCELYEKLLELDSNNMKEVNKKYSRKRMININYIIKKILEEMGCEKYKKIKLKISPKILEIYDNWWSSYYELVK